MAIRRRGERHGSRRFDGRNHANAAEPEPARFDRWVQGNGDRTAGRSSKTARSGRVRSAQDPSVSSLSRPTRASSSRKTPTTGEPTRASRARRNSLHTDPRRRHEADRAAHRRGPLDRRGSPAEHRVAVERVWHRGGTRPRRRLPLLCAEPERVSRSATFAYARRSPRRSTATKSRRRRSSARRPRTRPPFPNPTRRGTSTTRPTNGRRRRSAGSAR